MPKVNRAGLSPLKPFWTTADGATVRLYLGDVEEVLRRLPAGSVHCVVTSPPYWGLRDYGTGTWTGGDPACSHESARSKGRADYGFTGEIPRTEKDGGHGRYAKKCPDCGAVRTDYQIGSEPSPQEYVDRMVGVFREVRRVLRDDGVLWLNLGDSYSGRSRTSYDVDPKWNGRGGKFRPGAVPGEGGQQGGSRNRDGSPGVRGLVGGNLVGVPWRVALALQADGWVLRQDVIWHKPSPMPESVKNRCTKAHEYVFLLTKSMDYYYDAEAIKSGSSALTGGLTNKAGSKRLGTGLESEVDYVPNGRTNKRSVWTVPSQGYEGSHFAVFPPKLIEPMILAGTSEHGCCAACGTPWRRVVEEKKLTRERPNDYTKRTGETGTGNSCANSVAGVETRTVGWESGCTCPDAVLGEPVPCVVLDPFVGSGTTCCVAVENGRHGWGIDLSQQYLEKNAVPRIEGVLLARPGLARLLPERKRLGG